MQKARRFTCSTVCQSSPSNTSVRTRKKSRASSAGGDSAKVRDSVEGPLEDKRKSRSDKGNVSLLSTSPKPKKKAAKQCRAAKPNAGSLQSTVVLAPFYTLKKCFQNKLVDMYSLEKTKKLNQKTRRAKQKNLSFEYDIIELKPLDQKVKKEGKSSKRSRMKSRSASYCQCNRAPGKEDGKAAERRSRQKRKASSREEISPRASSYSEQSRNKRKKLNFGFPVPGLKFETSAAHDHCPPREQFAFSEGNQGLDALSSRSKCESWETYSNSPSCREEHVQGSLAISTTSFDSYLEQFDKGNWETKKKCQSRMQQTTNADLLPKSTAINLIVNVERKNSDGEIVDFMDREPQTQLIPSSCSYQQWQPLRRQSKTKRKKPETDSAATGYYLRSCSKEKDALGAMYLPTNPQECKYSPANTTKTIQVEVGTQVEDTSQCPNRSPATSHQHIPLHQTQAEPSCDTKLSCQKMRSPSREPSGDPEPLQEQQQQQQSEFFEGQREDAGLGLLGERSNMSSVELMAGFSDRFQGPTDSHQPQDKEYIFGPRNSGSGLGESCEYSFGLKWALSDDED